MADEDMNGTRDMVQKLAALFERLVEKTNTAGTDVPLLVHIDRILSEHQKAVDKSAATLEYRLDVLNHWRAESLSDRELFVQKNVYNEMHAQLERRMDAVERIQARLQGIGLVFLAGAAVTGAVVAHLLKL